MAKNDQAGAAATPEAEGGGGKKKLIMMVILGVVLVGLSVGGTLVAMSFLSDDTGAEAGADAAADPAAAAAAVAPVKLPAIYFPLLPAIVVNFDAHGKQRYLQAEISLLIREDDVVAAVEQHSAMLQHSLLMLFGAQDYNELQTAEGRELLRQLALEELHKRLEAEIGKPGIEQVLFTSFVMQ